MPKNKEFLYIGYYVDNEENTILKIGTTDDLKRRRYEHHTKYRRAKAHTLPPENTFEYLWTLALSKYNTLRYEDRNKLALQEMGIGEYVRNDRFVLREGVTAIPITIRKTYTVDLSPIFG